MDIHSILSRLLPLLVQHVARRIPRKAERPLPTRGVAGRHARSFQAFVSRPAQAEQARPAVPALDGVVVEEASIGQVESSCVLLSLMLFILETAFSPKGRILPRLDYPLPSIISSCITVGAGAEPTSCAWGR